MAARVALTSGPAETHPNAAHKGRRLDVTLPEEHTAPPPRASSGAVGAPAAASAGGEGFQDLASLLKEAAQPSPVPVRQR
ncbi:MAG TPA: hypothetical protein VFX49_13190, partial [Chloroflexota bacterium]|nr:hypothetical protein [Chloroflexota bacterium]